MFCMTASADAALPEETPLAGVDKKMPMLELLPVGSTLTKVSVTEYAGPRLSLLMTASSMTVVAPHEAAGKNAEHLPVWEKQPGYAPVFR